MTPSIQSEIHPLTRVLLKHPRQAFVDDRTVRQQWRELGFTAPPDVKRASAEYERFAELIAACGAAIHWLPRNERVRLDSIYVRDASIVSDAGIVLCRMGKLLRRTEPEVLADELGGLAVPGPVAGRIEPPGTLEGGDVVWLDSRTIAVGRGYRTNDEGIAQLTTLLKNVVDTVLVVPLPHWRGPGDVMHLMSLISPVDANLAVVYSPLLPVPFRERLLERGMMLVEVPDREFATMGTNVLALGPRRCVMLSGNPATRSALERAGAEVYEYEGTEISLKGGGGPTCLTRPLARDVPIDVPRHVKSTG